jgi:hypothetical protein
MKRPTPILIAALLGAFFVAAGGSPVDAKCPAGEVWGDVGCQPATQPSLLVRAGRKIKAKLRHKITAKPQPDTRQQ